MTITANTTINDVFNETSNAMEVLVKHVGEMRVNRGLSMVTNWSIKQVADYLGWNQDQIEALLKDLNEG